MPSALETILGLQRQREADPLTSISARMDRNRLGNDLSNITAQRNGRLSALLRLEPPRNGYSTDQIDDIASQAGHAARGADRLEGLAFEANTDPMTGIPEQQRIAGIQDRKAAEAAYLDPRATAIREDQQANALMKALAPIMAKSSADASLRDENFQRDLARDAMNHDAILQRQLAVGEATGQRQQHTQQAIDRRQRLGQLNIDLRARKGELNKLGPATGLNYLGELITGSRGAKQAEIDAIMQQISGLGSSETEGALAGIMNQGFNSLDEAIDAGAITDVTPEEYAEFSAIWSRLAGR